jgi:hypothetical protein
MRKITVKQFEELIQNYYFNLQFTQEDKNELYQLYLQIYSINTNIVECLTGIRQILFVREKVDNDNVDYYKSFNIDYSSNMFSNELLRHYSFNVLSHILTIGMRDVSFECILFFENRNPKLWTEKLNFYKSKLKKACIENSYVYMTEMLDKLYRVLVKLHYDLEKKDLDDTFIWIRLLTDNYPLYEKIYGDKDGNFDESFILSDYYFKSTTADEIISNYDSKLEHDCNVPQLPRFS